MPSVVITGANRGIGLEFVRQYAADGWRVHACCRRPDEARELAETLGVASIHAVDVAAPESLRAFAREIAGPLDVVVANAGVYGGNANEFGSIDYAAWDEAFAVNVRGVVATAESFAPHLRAARGRFAAISSRMGSIEEATAGAVSYRTTKAAVNMASKMIAAAFAADGVAAAPFHPGWVRTDMGGPNAEVAAKDCVAGLRRCIAQMRPDPSPPFRDYLGTEIPW